MIVIQFIQHNCHFTIVAQTFYSIPVTLFEHSSPLNADTLKLHFVVRAWNFNVLTFPSSSSRPRTHKASVNGNHVSGQPPSSESDTSSFWPLFHHLVINKARSCKCVVLPASDHRVHTFLATSTSCILTPP